MQMRGGRAAAKKYVDTVTENNEDGGEDDADDSTDNGDDPHKDDQTRAGYRHLTLFGRKNVNNDFLHDHERSVVLCAVMRY